MYFMYVTAFTLPGKNPTDIVGFVSQMMAVILSGNHTTSLAVLALRGTYEESRRGQIICSSRTCSPD